MTEHEQDIRESIEGQKELYGHEVDIAYLLDVIDQLRGVLGEKEWDELIASQRKEGK